jgi:1-acyl-sn-glycerol-3-phosphate acyltransferase
MIYDILRWIAGIALHWFYRDIRIIGAERIPDRGPLFIAVNHQNALVDSLAIGWLVRRRITMTAKATLANNPFIAAVFKVLGVIPLRRTHDESAITAGHTSNRERNQSAFQDILNVLENGGAVLVFPEGKSHNRRELEPLKTGLARLALQARTERRIAGVKILPIGLVFEDKGTPGTVLGAHIGELIEMDSWIGDDHRLLTHEVAARLRRVSDETAMPPELAAVGKHRTLTEETLIGLAEWWGLLTHRLPVRIARNIAVHLAGDADQPAMLTILVGISLVMLTYAVYVGVVAVVFHSFVAAALYLASLLCGAYWAAFRQHEKRSDN